jgi:hypothetical protein
MSVKIIATALAATGSVFIGVAGTAKADPSPWTAHERQFLDDLHRHGMYDVNVPGGDSQFLVDWGWIDCGGAVQGYYPLPVLLHNVGPSYEYAHDLISDYNQRKFTTLAIADLCPEALRQEFPNGGAS